MGTTLPISTVALVKRDNSNMYEYKTTTSKNITIHEYEKFCIACKF